MNKIRKEMTQEVELFISVLRETYRLIEEYQLNRTGKNETRLRLKFFELSRHMEKFKPFLQRRWQVYVEALDNQERFPISDLVFALDCAVHQMHLRAGNQGFVRKDMMVDALSLWSVEMKNFLDERRKAVM